MRANAINKCTTLEIKDGKVVTMGYGYIATSIMEEKNISLGAKCLYAYLTCKAGISDQCFPSNATIMEVLSIKSKITLNKYKLELVNKGLLRVEERTYKSGRLTSNYYYPTKMTRNTD